MKPNCFFSRLDRLNYQNGYYRVQMGLTEDILGATSLWLSQFYWITLGDRQSNSDHPRPWLTISKNQLPNVCEEQ